MKFLNTITLLVVLGYAEGWSWGSWGSSSSSSSSSWSSSSNSNKNSNSKKRNNNSGNSKNNNNNSNNNRNNNNSNNGRSKSWGSTTTKTTSWTSSTTKSSQNNKNKWNNWDWNDFTPSDDKLLECSGHVGNVYGDPHILTFDQGAYSCQAEGEFVMVSSGDDLEIQARFEKLSSRAASVTKAIAIAAANTEVIQVGFAEYDSGSDTTVSVSRSCPIHIYIGEELQAASVGSVLEGDGYKITIKSSTIDVQLYDGNTPTSAVQFQPQSFSGDVGCLFTAYFCLPSSDQDLLDNTVGLLGTPDHDSTNEWIIPSTGETTKLSSNDEDGYEYCTTYYCIAEEEDSLFVHEDGRGGKSFADLENCQGAFEGGFNIDDVDEEIKAICGEDNMDCLVDGHFGGPDQARSALEVQNTTAAIQFFEDPVDPTPQVTSSCPDDIVLLHTDGETAFDILPLSVVEQTGDSVTLKVTGAFASEKDVQYIEFEEDFVAKCISEESVSAAYSEEIRVTCPSDRTKSTLVKIVVSDSGLGASDTADAAECCHAGEDTNPKVKYAFLVSCVPQCPETARR